MLSPPCALEVELINGDYGYSDRVLWPTNYKRVSAMRMILPVGEKIVTILQIKQRAPAKATRQNDRQKARVQLLLMSMKPPESPPVFGTGWADLPWADLGTSVYGPIAEVSHPTSVKLSSKTVRTACAIVISALRIDHNVPTAQVYPQN